MKKLEDFGVPYPSRHISAVNSCTKGACRGLNQENLALFVQRNQRKKTVAIFWGTQNGSVIFDEDFPKNGILV